MIYGSSRADVNRVSKVICVILTAQCNWFKKPTLPFEPIKCLSKYFRFPALRASCIPLLFVVVDSSCTFAQFWLFAAVTLDLVLWNSSKSALDMLINSLTHGNEVTSILFLTWCFLRFYLLLVHKVLRVYAGIHGEEQYLFAYYT